MNFNPIYKIIFSHNGDIIVDKYYTETETIYLNHIYPDLTTFLCACAINDGEIPNTDEVYHEVRKTFINTCCINNDFNDVAINMSESDTVGRRIALTSFYSLSDSHITFLQNKYNYFPEASFMLEDRLEEISEELYNFHTILKYSCNPSLKNIVERQYKKCIMYKYRDYSNYNLTKNNIENRIHCIYYELEELQELKCKYQMDNKLNEKLNIIEDAIKYLEYERLTLKFNNKNSEYYVSDENLEIKLKDIDEKMTKYNNRVELDYQKLEYYSQDSTYDVYEFDRYSRIIYDLEEDENDYGLQLTEEYNFLKRRLNQLNQLHQLPQN